MEDHSAVAAETYGTALLTEEIGEVIIVCGTILQLVGKAGRFGMDTPGVKDPLTGIIDMSVTPRTKLVEETGDLIAAIDYLCHRGILDIDAVYKRRSHKLKKLLDPDSKDNLGRRLAP
jgi:NTP pyrophosphatase (non-canonical NTP hydrolase)